MSVSLRGDATFVIPHMYVQYVLWFVSFVCIYMSHICHEFVMSNNIMMVKMVII